MCPPRKPDQWTNPRLAHLRFPPDFQEVEVFSQNNNGFSLSFVFGPAALQLLFLSNTGRNCPCSKESGSPHSGARKTKSPSSHLRINTHTYILPTILKIRIPGIYSMYIYVCVVCVYTCTPYIQLHTYMHIHYIHIERYLAADSPLPK